MYQSNAYVWLVQNYWSSLKFTENLWLEIFKNFQIVTASGSSHHINLSLFLCLFLKLWNFAKIEPGLKWNFLPVELQMKGPKNDRYRKLPLPKNYRYSLSNGKIVGDLSLYWSDTESTNHILNTVCPITSGVAQRKRVGLITQRSKDRNLPPLYQSRAKSANEKRF